MGHTKFSYRGGRGGLGRGFRRRATVVLAALGFVLLVNTTAVLIASDFNAQVRYGGIT